MAAKAKKKLKQLHLSSSRPIPGAVRIWAVWEAEEMRGHVLLTEVEKEAIIWDIWVEPTRRRMGYATALLTGLQTQYDALVTSWRTSEGKELCLKCGFSEEAEEGKHGFPKLIWAREVEDASEDAES